MITPVAGVRQIALAPHHVGIVINTEERLFGWDREVTPEVIIGGAVGAQGKIRPNFMPAVLVGRAVGKTPAIARAIWLDEAARSVEISVESSVVLIMSVCRVRTLPRAAQRQRQAQRHDRRHLDPPCRTGGRS